MNSKEGKVIIHSKKNTRMVPKTDSIVDSVVDRFLERSIVGKNKYNADLDRDDLSFYDWINHMQEELHDAILYLEKIKTMLGSDKKASSWQKEKI